MPTQRAEYTNNQIPSPFPEGWYFVASRQDLMRARVIAKTWMGENIVVWRDDAGNACVAEAYCPHLGSYLGPETGGRVSEGKLVCPFHGYEFDISGQCVAAPFSDPPRNTWLKVFDSQEVGGLIFAWWGIGGRPPQWSLHPDRPSQEGWSAPEIRTVRFPGHPQETTENSVDLAHFLYVHGYGNVDRVGRLEIDGAYLQSRFDFRTVRKILGFANFTMDVSAVTHVYGLGYSFVDIHERLIGMDMRMWVLATPVDGIDIDLVLVSQVREIRNPKRRLAGLGFLPVGLRAPIFNKFVAASQHQDVLQDVTIWRHKRYRSRPRLCRADGEIMPFRAYCSQFYSDPSDVEKPGALAPDRASP
ncbi:MAG: Rieske 2Fe-2S domain-containing protein [Chloroflexi bacterium]|nr:Rieske 2Fe-2S domain-containing protein [Chloroflexota bacterium]